MSIKIEKLDYDKVTLDDKDIRAHEQTMRYLHPHLPPLYQTEDEEPKEEQKWKVRWPKDNSFLKVGLNPPQLRLMDGIDNPIHTITEEILTSFVNKEDGAIVRAIIEYAKKQGYTKLILIDEAFIREIIEKQIPKKVTMLGQELICPRCMCGYGRPAERTRLERSVHHCKWCGQVLDWGVIPYED